MQTELQVKSQTAPGDPATGSKHKYPLPRQIYKYCMWYHAAGGAGAELQSYLWPIWQQIRPRQKEGNKRKHDLIPQMSEKQVLVDVIFKTFENKIKDAHEIFAL